MVEAPIDLSRPSALRMLSSERPRNVGWVHSAGFLFGDWGTSRLYVLGLALFFAGRSSLWLISLMSLLILAVGWAYTEISRIYPEGGGVYSAAKRKSQTLAVIGALLLFADYTVTASLSVLDAFHYFGLPIHWVDERYEEQVKKVTTPVSIARENHFDPSPNVDAGDKLNARREQPSSGKESLLKLNSPAPWALLMIGVIGLFSLIGPGKTGHFAKWAAIGMVFITLLICAFALPQLDWAQVPHRVGSLRGHDPMGLWISFCSIVLALSGVEAVANLTGVMVKPVARTSSRAIWTVAIEVAVFNVVLCLCMIALPVINRDAHLNDMLAYLSGQYVGLAGEWAVRVIGGVLLLSAGNTAITAMISIQYLMARDGELPRVMASLNRFGVPWMPAIVAAGAPFVVLLISHDLDHLASLYAIGVVGAIFINISMCTIHPRLRGWYRKTPMAALAVLLLGIWVSVAIVKRDALIFVSVVMAAGLSAREINRWYTRRHPRPTQLQEAVSGQLTVEALARPRIMVATYGSESLATAALAEAKKRGALLVVGFVREAHLALGFTVGLNAQTDRAALKCFSRYLELGHDAGVPIMPVYDFGEDAPALLAENAAGYACQTIIVGATKRGRLENRLRHGSFLGHLKKYLPEEIEITILNPDEESKDASNHT